MTKQEKIKNMEDWVIKRKEKFGRFDCAFYDWKFFVTDTHKLVTRDYARWTCPACLRRMRQGHYSLCSWDAAYYICKKCKKELLKND